MKTLEQNLTMYAAYHRDPRNVATHFFGIPMIVVSVAALLARASVTVGGTSLTAAHVAVVASVVFYLLLDLRFGLTMAALMGLSLVAGLQLAALSFGWWLGLSLGLFVGGWVFQTVGHIFEGRKPAFVDDLSGLMVGPLFLVAEVAFALKLRPELRSSVDAPAA